MSEVADIGVPLDWEPLVATVVLEEFEELEETEDEELDR